MDNLFVFISMTFPKAGIQLGSVPLTLSILLFIFVVLRNLNFVLPGLRTIRGLLPCYLLLLLFGIFVLLGNLGVISAYELCQALVVIASPLAITAVKRIDFEKGCKLTCVSLAIVSGFAILQRFFGIVYTSIPGLTFTYGQNLTNKAIGYGMAGTAEASKMPSSYQNGNGYGLFIAMAIPLLLLWQPKTKGWKHTKSITLLTGIVGMLLCGSRSIMFPFSAMCLFILHNYQKKLPPKQRRIFRNSAMFLLLGGGLYLVLFQSELFLDAYNRYVVQTVSDPTASGRTLQWANMAQIVSHYDAGHFLRFLLIGEQRGLPGGGEGLFEFLFHFGAPATIGLYGCLLAGILNCWKRARPVAYGLICIFLAFCVDQSYYYPPSLMNYFIVTMLALRVPEANTGQQKEPVSSRVSVPYVSKYIKGRVT